MKQAVQNILENSDPNAIDALAGKLTQEIREAISKDVCEATDAAFMAFHSRISALEKKFMASTPSGEVNGQPPKVAAV